MKQIISKFNDFEDWFDIKFGYFFTNGFKQQKRNELRKLKSKVRHARLGRDKHEIHRIQSLEKHVRGEE